MLAKMIRSFSMSLDPISEANGRWDDQKIYFAYYKKPLMVSLVLRVVGARA